MVIFAVILGWLHPRRRELFRTAGNFSPRMASVVVVAAAPLIVQIVHHARLIHTDASAHKALGHWEDTAVFLIALLLVAALATFQTRGWRIPTWTTGAAVLVYGVASILYPAQASGWGRAWGTFGIAAALIFLVLAEWESRRRRRNPPGVQYGGNDEGR